MGCEDLICGSAEQASGGPTNGPKLTQRPREGYIFAPYVKLGFPDGASITVGNNSQPPGAITGLNNLVQQFWGLKSNNSIFNSAVISNFEYGFETGNAGMQCSVEILDAGGTSYVDILNYLNKTIADANKKEQRVWVDFGWIIQGKDGSCELVSVLSRYGKVIAGVPLKTQLNFDGGNVKIKFDISSPLATPAVYDEVFGKEDNLMDLKTALNKLFKDIPPKIDRVNFKSKNGGDYIFPASQGNRLNGPKAIWRMNQQDKLNVARQWISQYASTSKNSFTFIYNGSSPLVNGQPIITEITIQEDPTDKNFGEKCCNNSLATFVINGGSDSPVISFTPQLSWIFGDEPSGGGGGGPSGPNDGVLKSQEQTIPSNNGKDQGKPLKSQHAGSQMAISVKEHQWYTTPPKNHATQSKTGGEAGNKIAARLGIGRASPFEAELKIFGDPQWYGPIGEEGAASLIGKSFSILFINPFAPKKPSGKTDLDWLANPACSGLLSNKNYMIKKVNHQISNGTYVTSFKLHCLTPNADIYAGVNFGSNRPDQQCATNTLNVNKFSSPPLPKDVNTGTA